MRTKQWLNHGFYLALVAFAIFRIGPTFLANWQSEGTRPGNFVLRAPDGKLLAGHQLRGPVALIFWATWCGPCRVELSRLNQLIARQTISRESVIGITMGEEAGLIDRTARERGYLFANYADVEGSAAAAFRVQGTPTAIFIGNDGSVRSATTGLSPLLELRARRYLR